MQNELQKEVLGKKITRPFLRREMAETAVTQKGVSVALACRTFCVSEACYRCTPKLEIGRASCRERVLTDV